MPADDQERLGRSFDRRKFLTRAAIAGGAAWGVPVVTTIGLSRATATPCAGTATASEEPVLTADATAQNAARADSPCYQTCMERRANQEHEADVAYYTAVEQAGTDHALLIASAHQYRAKLAALTLDFRACTKTCT